MQPIKPSIALITGTLKLGGTTSFLGNLAGELVRRGVDCRVLCGEYEHPQAAEFARRHIPVSLQDERRAIFEDRLAAVLDELGGFRPDVVVATLAPFAFEVLRYTPPGVRRIAMVQSDDPTVYAALAHYAPCLDGVAGVSAMIVQRLAALPAFRAVPRHYLPYGVAMPEAMPERSRRNQPLRILYLGRIIREQKRVQLFPQILAALQQSAIPFHWTIAGDGPDRAALEPQLRCDGPRQRVEFIGPTAYADVPRLLANHDVFLLASDYEGLPLSLLEAMGHGLVPVVSDLPSGIPEVVDASNGCLVPVNEVAGYARAIIHLHAHRDELAAKSAAARRRVATEFSMAAMTDRWLAALPPATGTPPAWPQKYSIQAPLTARRKLPFSIPVRVLRRLVKKIRH